MRSSMLPDEGRDLGDMAHEGFILSNVVIGGKHNDRSVGILRMDPMDGEENAGRRPASLRLRQDLKAPSRLELGGDVGGVVLKRDHDRPLRRHQAERPDLPCGATRIAKSSTGTYCLGRSSPHTCRTKGRSRVPSSPPARTIAHT